MRSWAMATCVVAITVFAGFSNTTFAQGVSVDDVGTISGSLQTDIQQYNEDTLIGAPDVPESILSNTFVNVLFTRGGFTAGLRFESYQNPLLGIDPRFGSSGAGTGIGIPYRFATYENDYFTVTAGNFYEQFGSGMVLRLYEERNLGFDNSIDGLRLKFRPVNGLQLTGFIGRQRAFFDLSEGIIRGADASVDFRELDPNLFGNDVAVTLGASLVSRFQEDQNPFLNLPQNVLAWSGRGTIAFGNFFLEGEYAYKINDPGVANGGSFNPGNGLYVNTSYAAQGLGIALAAKRVDNLDLRSDRTAAGFQQQVNYLPALTKQHTWRLITLYPYATQPTGEFGLQGEVTFTLPKDGIFGDRETNVTVNYAQINALDTTRTSEFYYDAKFMPSDRIFYRDFNIEVTRKLSSDVKLTLSYIHLDYDQDVIEARASINESKFGVITTNFLVAEMLFKTGRGQSLRTELQWMGVTHEPGAELALQNGDWAMMLMEYAISPHWFFTAFAEYNYGNATPELQVLYPNLNAAYIVDALRVSVGYGRVRGGILCVGGICRPVPASNGFTLGVQHSF